MFNCNILRIFFFWDLMPHNWVISSNHPVIQCYITEELNPSATIQ